mgnify:CR=1 FL=1
MLLNKIPKSSGTSIPATFQVITFTFSFNFECCLIFGKFSVFSQEFFNEYKTFKNKFVNLTEFFPEEGDMSNINKEYRNFYFEKIINRFEKITKQDIRNNIIFKDSFCVNDFIKDYNSYKGNAYGMANTLTQTAFLRPKLKSKKVKNLFFTGQLTVPGPGVPPSLISGKLVADLITKHHSL